MKNRKEFKVGFTYLYMKGVYQKFFGWVLLLSGIFLLFSVVIAISNQNSLSQTNWISIILGIIIVYIGYKGTKRKW